MSNKLTAEERDSLAEFLTSPAWPGLLKKIDDLAANIDSNVLRYNLSDGPDGLVVEKARSEGARRLQLAIQSIKKSLKQG